MYIIDKIINWVKKPFDGLRDVKLDESKIIKFRNSIYIIIASFALPTLLSVILTFNYIFSIADDTGYQFAIIPVLVLMVIRPIETILILNTIYTSIKSNYKKLNLEYIANAFVDSLKLIIASSFLTIILTVLITVYFITLAVKEIYSIPIPAQKTVFVGILVIWVLKEYYDKILLKALAEINTKYAQIKPPVEAVSIPISK